jgi:serine-protein kinase ATM
MFYSSLFLPFQVLEWVEHAIPFGDFIADKSGKRSNDIGAHSRYYPGEWGHGQCRSHLDSAPRSEKRKAFDELCQNNSPVFRFFFVERFGHSMQCWYIAKTRYTRSVAVSSVVGHILGIGDRHTSNILVHQKTGEVVHIDFGIVFEQGKVSVNVGSQYCCKL